MGQGSRAPKKDRALLDKETLTFTDRCFWKLLQDLKYWAYGTSSVQPATVSLIQWDVNTH